MSINKTEITHWLKSLQADICLALEEADGKGKFMVDTWERKGGGGGVSRSFSDGRIIEKGGVNFSEVFGKTPENILKALQLPESDFFATGVSIVLHPFNPMVPIIHMNVRYFEMSNGTWWFGGGIDLTPHYIVEKEAMHFHKVLKGVCDSHHPDYYPAFKKWADDYFFLKHRNETRGIGGIFFDRLSGEPPFDKNQRFNFVKDVGKAFAPLYIHFMQANHDLPYGDRELQWQRLRRGRYVEFNLVWDKGTKFGLDTDGRTESILMSLPPQANWIYDYHPQEGSPEAATQARLRKAINWIDGA